MSHGMSLKRGLAEGAVVVASVLLALAADAWWDGRQARALEAEILSAVADEVAANRTELEQVVGMTQGDLDHIDLVIRTPAAVLAQTPPDSVRPIVLSLTRTATFNPIERAATILAQTPVSDSESLRGRTLVSEALREFSDVVEEHERLYRRADDVRSYLAVHAAADADNAFESLPGMLARQGPQVLAQLRSNEALVAALVNKAHIQGLYLGELQRALVQLDSLEVALRGML